VVGGVLFATGVLILRLSGLLLFEFDTALQTPLMIAFFTTIGLGASRHLLRVGGPQVLLFLFLAVVLVVLQDTLGIIVARIMGVNPLLGLIGGSITMTGGHGTGAAFGQLLQDEYAFPGAFTLAMAAATFGLVSGGLLGGPIGTRLIERLGGNARAASENSIAITQTQSQPQTATTEHDAFTVLKGLTIILTAMWIGSLLSGLLGRYMTLPAYIGSMLIAALIRNVDDTVPLIRIDPDMIGELGTIALDLFLAMALMSLRLWELLDLAIPMLVILCAEVVLMGLFAWFVTFRFMGRDYDAAVMAGGHCGFGLGATPNAVANMEALVERFGPAPRAFLVIPLVGAFFIDFVNAMIITGFINVFH
jgi:ESS family glutamate:Na+ symporter